MEPIGTLEAAPVFTDVLEEPGPSSDRFGLVPTELLLTVWPLVVKAWQELPDEYRAEADLLKLYNQVACHQADLWTNGEGDFFLFTRVQGGVLWVGGLMGRNSSLKWRLITETLGKYARSLGLKTLRAEVINPRLPRVLKRAGWEDAWVIMEHHT